ncbi:hypothetical protein [Roseobacter sinensis]|uniref:Uncharacterized protein n=1 Tax=Roseobacter sinensis TaxID=2931391 RepID=A0ABT3B9D0_9RHOB|nr:hypothetical protein [Roseobacter sp. WL0113]MCV3270165.1 hypothetical protein [Roseobacter sp. WL0113]
MIDDIARKAGNANRVNMIYAAPQSSLFSVPIVAEKVGCRCKSAVSRR